MMRCFVRLALTVVFWSHCSSPARLRSNNQHMTDGSMFAEASAASNNRQPCPAHCQETTDQKQQLEGARIFFLILVHNERTVEGALHLFRAIRDPRHIILVHIDAKAKDTLLPNNDNNETSALWQEIQECPCGSQVRVESVHSVEWGAWSMNDPTIDGMETAVKDYTGQWDVFINLAGDTLPVYTPNTLSTLLLDINKYNFVTSSSCETGLVPTNVYKFPHWWHKRQHYTQGDTEQDLVLNYTLSNGTLVTKRVITIHFGSQWVMLQSTFVRWFVSESKRDDSLPTLLAHHLQQSGKLMTDETFLSTLLMHAEEFHHTLPVVDEQETTSKQRHLLWNNGTRSHITAVRFERMDEHSPTAFGALWPHQRYDVAQGSGVDVPRPWGPYYLGVYDLGAIKASGALFVRKVSRHVDDNLYRLLPVEHVSQIPDISWPSAEVKLTPKPDWERWYSERMQQQEQDDEEYDHEELDEEEEEL